MRAKKEVSKKGSGAAAKRARHPAGDEIRSVAASLSDRHALGLTPADVDELEAAFLRMADRRRRRRLPCRGPLCVTRPCARACDRLHVLDYKGRLLAEVYEHRGEPGCDPGPVTPETEATALLFAHAWSMYDGLLELARLNDEGADSRQVFDLIHSLASAAQSAVAAGEIADEVRR